VKRGEQQAQEPYLPKNKQEVLTAVREERRQWQEYMSQRLHVALGTGSMHRAFELATHHAAAAAGSCSCSTLARMASLVQVSGCWAS
jgi:hypothetical protein